MTQRRHWDTKSETWSRQRGRQSQIHFVTKSHKRVEDNETKRKTKWNKKWETKPDSCPDDISQSIKWPGGRQSHTMSDPYQNIIPAFDSRQVHWLEKNHTSRNSQASALFEIFVKPKVKELRRPSSHFVAKFPCLDLCCSSADLHLQSISLSKPPHLWCWWCWRMEGFPECRSVLLHLEFQLYRSARGAVHSES